MRYVAGATITLAFVLFSGVHTDVQMGESHFDRVSIKRHTSSAFGMRRQRAPGREVVESATADQLIREAYGQDLRVVNLPDWATREQYDIVVTYTVKPGTPTSVWMPRMWRALLEERFALQAQQQPTGIVVIRHIEQPSED